VDQLTAPDGTTIAHQATGTGPPVVLVVGAFCDRTSTADLAALLADTFTVHEFDRRGRGDSGDTAPYAVQREVEDLTAVIAATGDVPYVYGHSSGAALALETAAAGVPMRGLVAYEPPYTAEDDGSGGSDELLQLLRQRLAGDDADGAAAAFLTTAGTPVEVVEMMRGGPGWPRMCAMAPALVYDLLLCNGGRVPTGRLARIDVPTLALAGGMSAPWAGRAAAAVTAAVPGGRQSVVAGQHHGIPGAAIAPVLREFFGTVAATAGSR
jgi:pimeloyl-ACP methyl ester carboxylesterase